MDSVATETPVGVVDGGDRGGDELSLLGIAALIFGWVYFLAWSLSFYPQCILNYRKGSVKGLSIDYVVLNVTGFMCYSLFTLLIDYSAKTRQSYIDVFGMEPEVEFNDVVFAVHGYVDHLPL